MPINSIDGEFSSTMFILNLGNKYQDCNSLKDTEGHYSMWSIMFILKYVCIRCAQHCILLRLCFPLKTDMWLSIDVTCCTTTQATLYHGSLVLFAVLSSVTPHSFLFCLSFLKWFCCSPGFVKFVFLMCGFFCLCVCFFWYVDNPGFFIYPQEIKKTLYCRLCVYAQTLKERSNSTHVLMTDIQT